MYLNTHVCGFVVGLFLSFDGCLGISTNFLPLQKLFHMAKDEGIH
jgi:hypothetical protein